MGEEGQKFAIVVIFFFGAGVGFYLASLFF